MAYNRLYNRSRGIPQPVMRHYATGHEAPLNRLKVLIRPNA